MTSPGADDTPIGPDELDGLFRVLESRRIALAVSGGVDSIVLMHLVARWLASDSGAEWQADRRRIAFAGPPAERDVGLPRRRPTTLEPARWLDTAEDPAALADKLASTPVVVLTVDHGLRPDSAREAAFVEAEARRLGFPHQTLVWRHRASGIRIEGNDTRQQEPPTSGVQEKARQARYGLMADCIEHETWSLFEAGEISSHPLSAGHQKRTIVTAHHRDDVIETCLMRLKRGSGLDGLASIRTFETLRRQPTPDRPYPSEIDLCRPLLDQPKSRLLATARSLGLTWAEDPSNASRQFERVRQRKDIPSLEALGFSRPALHLSIERLRRASAFIETRLSEQLRGAGTDAGSVDLNDGLFGSISLPGLAASDARLAAAMGDARAEELQRILRYVVDAFGGGEEAPALAQIEDVCRHLTRTARKDGPDPTTRRGASARTLAGCRIDYWCAPSVPDGRIRVWREAGRAGLPELHLAPGDGSWWDNRFAVSASPASPGPVIVKALGGQGWAELKRRVPAMALWKDIPPGAAATLPAFWQGEELITVPYFTRPPESLPLALRQTIRQEWDARSGVHERYYRAEFRPTASL